MHDRRRACRPLPGVRLWDPAAGGGGPRCPPPRLHRTEVRDVRNQIPHRARCAFKAGLCAPGFHWKRSCPSLSTEIHERLPGGGAARCVAPGADSAVRRGLAHQTALLDSSAVKRNRGLISVGAVSWIATPYVRHACPNYPHFPRRRAGDFGRKHVAASRVYLSRHHLLNRTRSASGTSAGGSASSIPGISGFAPAWEWFMRREYLMFAQVGRGGRQPHPCDPWRSCPPAVSM